MIFRFAKFSLDSAARELSRDGKAVPLQAKSFDALAFLLQERHRVVSRDEFFAELWPGASVSPTALNVCINAVRKAIDDTGDGQNLIRTYRGRGYRFVGDVQVEGAPPARRATPFSSGRTCVAREFPLSQLASRLETSVAARRGRLVLIEGDAGIGKTRLVDEFIATIAKRGVNALVGRCIDGSGAPPFLPWAQIIEAYAGLATPTDLRSALGVGAPSLAQLAPVVREHLPDIGRDRPESEHARLRLFGAMGRFLESAADHRGLVVVIDDLHWADESSLSLLESVLHSLNTAPVLIICTMRGDEIEPTDPRHAVLGTLQRDEFCTRIPLGGLDTEAVRLLLSDVGAGDAPDDFVTDLTSGTGGNPFFILETLRHLLERNEHGEVGEGLWSETVSTESIVEVEGVRALVSRRLRRFPEPTLSLLGGAAVLGSTLDFHLLQAMLRDGADESGDLAIEHALLALEAGILVEAPEAKGQFRFSHPLIREVLYSDIASLRRAQLHLRAATALESMSRDGASQSQIAEHLICSTEIIADPATIDRAIEASTLAGRNAGRSLAFEDAAMHFGRALELVTTHRPEQASERCDLLLESMAAYSASGDSDRAEAAAREASTLARELGSVERLGRAALGGSGSMVQRLATAQEQIDSLEEALDAVGDEHPQLRALLLARVALALSYLDPDQYERRCQLSQEAEEVANRIGDREALYWAWVAKYFTLSGPNTASEQLELVSRLEALANEFDESVLLVRAQAYRVGSLFQSGDAREAARATQEMEASAERACSPLFSWTALCFRANQAQCEGRLADAEALNLAAQQAGKAAGQGSADLVFTCQLGAQRLSQWRLPELESAMVGLAEEHPFVLIPATLTLAAAQRGDMKTVADRLGSTRFDLIPQNNMRLGTIAILASAAAQCADLERAERFYEELILYGDGLVVVGNATACLGSIGRPMGELAAVLGRPEEAREHFERALADEHRNGMPLWAAHTAFAYAKCLMKSGSEPDLVEARGQFAAAHETAKQFGVHEFAAAIDQPQRRTVEPQVKPDPNAVSETS